MLISYAADLLPHHIPQARLEVWELSGATLWQ
jgi:hypothetical protein